MKKIITIGLILGLTGCSLFTSKVEANTNINGSVESRCSINTDTAGYYGNPNACISLYRSNILSYIV